VPSISITWQAHMDERTCPICQALHGYTWTFTMPEPMPDQLTHPQYGVVWNTTVGSQAHGHQRFNCRCSIKPEINVKDIKQKLETLKNELEQQTNE
jgi:uncharacterized protein with gpF-like domain